VFFTSTHFPSITRVLKEIVRPLKLPFKKTLWKQREHWFFSDAPSFPKLQSTIALNLKILCRVFSTSTIVFIPSQKLSENLMKNHSMNSEKCTPNWQQGSIQERGSFLLSFQSTVPTHTKWNPHPLTPEERIKGQNILETYAPIRTTGDRVRRYRDAFMLINGFTSFEDAIPGLIGQMTSYLSPSTVVTYWKHIVHDLPITDAMKRASTALRVLAANTEGSHALDLTQTHIQQILQQLPWQSPVRAATELVWKTGLRMAELQKVMQGKMSFGQESVRVTIYVAKNVRSRAERQTIELPYWFGPISEATQAFWINHPRDHCPFDGGHFGTVLQRLSANFPSTSNNIHLPKIFHPTGRCTL
jgi:hypothetical protein